MKRNVAALFAVCVLLFGRPALAHRIDEYLPATILSLEANRAQASMRLIPGIVVAPSVIAAIDSNHDGIFSEGEQRTYADRVLADLSISINGQAAKPQLDSWTFPDPSQLREGLGEISIQYHVDLLLDGPSDRSLILANHHLNSNSVYLMNVEVPRDSEIRILAQKRNQLQSIYELDYQQLHTASMPSGSARGLRARLNVFQFSSLFHLGMRHIAEGTDHLLFLLVLLLPAQLVAVGAHGDESPMFGKAASYSWNCQCVHHRPLSDAHSRRNELWACC
jgi:hypothetical protein